ncbi:MAG: aerotolerance regulator BatA [Crocinitomicaceae bacterium]|nr:aerotolerance regulator BatA [Crocinitomicaceae bacterium]|tara:strand:+ start:1684 stop:2709 length:1026 start_codon:yes stop_codon:yes gene_type:complete
MLDLFNSYHFKDAWILWFILIIPLFILHFIFSKKTKHETIKTSSLILFQGIKGEYGNWYNYIKFSLKMLGLFFLIVASARPQESIESATKKEMFKEGIDIVISMDASGSMMAKDFSPDRFQASKYLAKEFIEDRKNDRVGLVIFEGEAYTQCPLTSDKNILLELIEDAKQGIVEPGTAIGTGLATAINRLRESSSPSKVVILLTDGVNTHGKIHPLNAAEMAKELQIRVYTIGVGTNGKAKTPVAIDPFSGRYIYDYVDVEIDESTLKEIASETGGKYFRATDNDKLKEVYKEINQLEKAKIKTIEFEVDLPEKSSLFIQLGLLFFCIEFLLSKLIIKSVS